MGCARNAVDTDHAEVIQETQTSINIHSEVAHVRTKLVVVEFSCSM